MSKKNLGQRGAWLNPPVTRDTHQSSFIEVLLEMLVTVTYVSLLRNWMNCRLQLFDSLWFWMLLPWVPDCPCVAMVSKHFAYSVFAYSVFAYSVSALSVFAYSGFAYSVFAYPVFAYSVFAYSVFAYSVFAYSVFNYSVFAYSVSAYSVLAYSEFAYSVFVVCSQSNFLGHVYYITSIRVILQLQTVWTQDGSSFRCK